MPDSGETLRKMMGFVCTILCGICNFFFFLKNHPLSPCLPLQNCQALPASYPTIQHPWEQQPGMSCFFWFSKYRSTSNGHFKTKQTATSFKHCNEPGYGTIYLFIFNPRPGKGPVSGGLDHCWNSRRLHRAENTTISVAYQGNHIKNKKKNLGVICMKLINPSGQRYDQRRQMSRENPPEQKTIQAVSG